MGGVGWSLPVRDWTIQAIREGWSSRSFRMVKHPRPAIASSRKVAHTNKPLNIGWKRCGIHMILDVEKAPKTDKLGNPYFTGYLAVVNATGKIPF